MDTSQGGGAPPPAAEPEAPVAASTPTSSLYGTAAEASEAVSKDFLYWTGKLTDTSVQLSYAVLGANWAVFGSVDGILENRWSTSSVALVIVSLGLAVLGAWLMGGLHRRRIDYAESDIPRWNREFAETAGRRDPWPFTKTIEQLGASLRMAKTWLPVSAGALFVVALF